MSKTYEEVKALKNAPSAKERKRNSLENANDIYNKLVETGKVEKRGNNLLTLNEQIVNIKLKYSL